MCQGHGARRCYQCPSEDRSVGGKETEIEEEEEEEEEEAVGGKGAML